VTLPPFAQFWQANQLIEMPENPENARLPALPPSGPIRRRIR
jgi:biotin/methionine sulfoxide reductase